MPPYRSELPPRARRIRKIRFCNIPNDGTTSACAENTVVDCSGNPITWNYLRVRGEYMRATSWAPRKLELPPRARRILGAKLTAWQGRGTTSACAENTHTSWLLGLEVWNYLRVRGEYKCLPAFEHTDEELPPRARRICEIALDHALDLGTTSACAENTYDWLYGLVFSRNYLRVRGEYLSNGKRVDFSRELPPRARRILHYA